MKARLDCLLTQLGFASSREKAKVLIRSGCVYVDGRKADKAGSIYDSGDVPIEVRGDVLKYVSRGGLKLEKACDCWSLPIEGAVCMDIGASTGGFTDCMLQRGAARVYAVDVGYGQLAEKLCKDSRVVNMEKTNFRYLTREQIPEELDFASVDVSFISLTKILLSAGNFLKTGGEMVCLIKPQFEAGREKVGKNGVVREPAVHREVIGRILDFADSAGFEILHLEYSPIRGPEGNIEYLLHICKREDGPGLITSRKSEAWQEEIARIVKSAHEELDRA